MRILYGIQGTGNGHVSRAREIIPILKKYADVDIVLSGTQSELDPGHGVKFRLKGFGFVFGKNGGVDSIKTVSQFHLREFIRDLKNLPVKDYDLVIQDVEPVTAWACKLNGINCLEMSHQICLTSPNTPKVKGFHFGKIILENYTPHTHKIGFHFRKYDDFIHTPVIRSEIRKLQPRTEDYYLVYLPAFGDEYLYKLFENFPEENFVIFSKHSRKPYSKKNAEFRLLNNADYIAHLQNCKGLICGAGFEAPSEAIFLKKKLLCIPMTNQYEQLCNAKALEELGIPVVWNKRKFVSKMNIFLSDSNILELDFPDETEMIIQQIMTEKTGFNSRV